jgi:hypothetical protein
VFEVEGVFGAGHGLTIVQCRQLPSPDVLLTM